MKGPFGTDIEYDAKITEMSPERGIAWQSVDGEVENSGQVRFEEVSIGRTRIDVMLNYSDPPGGKVGEVVADAISNPEREIRRTLRTSPRRSSTAS